MELKVSNVKFLVNITAELFRYRCTFSKTTLPVCYYQHKKQSNMKLRHEKLNLSTFIHQHTNKIQRKRV